MSDDNNQPPQSFKPPERGSQHYKIMRREITSWQPPELPDGVAASPVTTPSATTTPASVNESVQTSRYRRLFNFNLNADIEEGELMDERQFLVDLIFKPNETGLKLRPEEIQLLLSYIGEILKELEAEEQVIEGQKASENKEAVPCQ